MALLDLLKKNKDKGSDFRGTMRDMIRAEIEKFKSEVKQELQVLLKEALGEEGALTLKGERGFTPKAGIDFLTPSDMARLRSQARGSDGLAGAVGLSGRDGKDGRNGLDGVSVTAEEIKALLAPEIEEIKREIIRTRKGSKGGGGGVGDIQHESFSVNAGTTTVQTDFPIAGLGTAIYMASYQGQNLELTNHYTVGSDLRTITFHADVQSQMADNTTFAITYSRG